MSEQLKVISEPEQKKQITVQGKSLIVWTLDVQRGSNGDGEKLSVELLKQPGNAPPSVGSVVLGDLTQNDYGWRLKIPSERKGGGGRSPQETKAIQRQHSQEMALRFVEAGGAELPYGNPPWGASGDEPIKANLAAIKRLTDWFEDDIGAPRAA